MNLKFCQIPQIARIDVPHGGHLWHSELKLDLLEPPRLTVFPCRTYDSSCRQILIDSAIATDRQDFHFDRAIVGSFYEHRVALVSGHAPPQIQSGTASALRDDVRVEDLGISPKAGQHIVVVVAVGAG